MSQQIPEYYPGKQYQPLFDYLHDQFGVLALESDMTEIIEIVGKMEALHPSESAGVKGAAEVKAQLEYLQGYIAGLADRADDDFERGVLHQRIGTLHNALLVIDLYKEGFDESPTAAGDGKEDATKEIERRNKIIEDNLKMNMRLNMPGISPQEQEATWQEFKKRNDL